MLFCRSILLQPEVFHTNNPNNQLFNAMMASLGKTYIHIWIHYSSAFQHLPKSLGDHNFCHNILKRFDILPSFSPATSETEHDYL